MMTEITSLRLKLRQEKLNKEYKQSVERASKCTPRNTKEVYTWEADYGDGKQQYEKDKISSVFDNTARPLPLSLYLDAKDWENGINKFEPPVLTINYLSLYAFGYHIMTKALPLWLFIMLYW